VTLINIRSQNGGKIMKKIFKIIIIILILLILIFLGLYLNKYRIISNYQNKILEIEENGNYKMSLNNEDNYTTNIFVKNNISIENDEANNTYIVTDNNTNKQYFISDSTENYVRELTEDEKIQVTTSIYSFCSIIDLNDEVSIFSLIKADPKMKLSTANYNNTECYKLETSSINTRSDYTVFFDKETKLPIALQLGNDEPYYDIEIEVGNVQDNEISIEDIINSLN
jgi:uncharacterized protein YxeA